MERKDWKKEDTRKNAVFPNKKAWLRVDWVSSENFRGRGRQWGGRRKRRGEGEGRGSDTENEENPWKKLFFPENLHSFAAALTTTYIYISNNKWKQDIFFSFFYLFHKHDYVFFI